MARRRHPGLVAATDTRRRRLTGTVQIHRGAGWINQRRNPPAAPQRASDHMMVDYGLRPNPPYPCCTIKRRLDAVRLRLSAPYDRFFNVTGHAQKLGAASLLSFYEASIRDAENYQLSTFNCTRTAPACSASSCGGHPCCCSRRSKPARSHPCRRLQIRCHR